MREFRCTLSLLEVSILTLPDDNGVAFRVEIRFLEPPRHRRPNKLAMRPNIKHFFCDDNSISMILEPPLQNIPLLNVSLLNLICAFTYHHDFDLKVPVTAFGRVHSIPFPLELDDLKEPFPLDFGGKKGGEEVLGE